MQFATSALVTYSILGPVAKVALNPSANNVDQGSEKPQVEFPASQFPIDIASGAPRDAGCARERYLARRFAMSPHVAAAVAAVAFGEARQ
jgi:hypothetical protein